MDYPDSNRPSNAYLSLTALSLSGFRFLGWINGIAVLILVAFSLGVVGGDVDPPDLQEPIAAYAAGLAFCAIGMLFSYLTHFSLFRQIAAGRARRTHWIPMLITVLAYLLGVAAFVMGCWSAVSVTASQPKGDVSYNTHTVASPASPSRLAAVLPLLSQRAR